MGNAKTYAATGLEALLNSYRTAVRLANVKDFHPKKKKRMGTALVKRKALVNVTKVTVLHQACIWHHLLLFFDYGFRITLATPNGYIYEEVHEFIL